MRILVLTTTFPRWKDDIRPPFVYELYKRLQSSGSEIVVLAPHCLGAKKFEFMDGMKVYRFSYFIPNRYQKLVYGAGVIPNLKKSNLAKIQLPLLFILELYNAFVLIKKEHIDVVNSHWLLPQGLVGALCKTILGTHHVAVVHGSDINIIKRSRILRQAYYYVVNHTDMVTVNSGYIKNSILSLSGKRQDIIEQIPMGVDTSIFNPGKREDLKKQYDAEYLIFSIGRLIDWKGMDYLIRSMVEVIKKYPKAKLIIGGSGPEKNNLKKLTENMGIESNIIFTGYIQNVDLPRYYASADVFVLPSIEIKGQTEALGVVLLEAMASGTPVVGSNVGGIPDIIENGYNGLLFTAGSSSELSGCIIKILSDKEMSKKFSANGIGTVNDRFLWNDISEKFYNINKKLLDSTT